MTSVVFDKLRAAMGGRPSLEHDVPAKPPTDTLEDVARRVARLAADVERLATAQRAIESKLQAIDARHDQFEAGFRDSEGSRAVASTEFRQAIARLQTRAADTATERATIVASVERLDEAHAQLRQDQNRSAERIDALVAADRVRAGSKSEGAKDVAARVAQQASAIRDEFNERDAERSRAFASRIAAAHVTSFVALVAALAAATIAVWKQL